MTFFFYKTLQILPCPVCSQNIALLAAVRWRFDAVVVLWSLTSPYHFSSPAIDSGSVGRRTDKGMCMTLPTGPEEPTPVGQRHV